MKKNPKHIYLLSSFFLILLINLLENTALAQKANISMDNKTILIGDQKSVIIQFAYPIELKFTWPQFADSLTSHIEIVSKSKIDTTYSSDKKNLTLSQTIKITSFDSGSWTLPSFAFPYHKPNDTTQYISYTDSLLLNVNTVAIDTTKEIKDIKSPYESSITFAEILPYLLILLGLIGVVFLIIYYFRRRKKGKPFINMPEKPNIPPHEIALQALENLRLKKLWQSGKVKEYHTELTEILRIYLLQRYAIEAMEMTSDEIMESMKTTNINDTEKNKLKSILLIADLVKFAKEQPLPQEHDLSMNYAKEFIVAAIQKLDTI